MEGSEGPSSHSRGTAEPGSELTDGCKMPILDHQGSCHSITGSVKIVQVLFSSRHRPVSHGEGTYNSESGPDLVS